MVNDSKVLSVIVGKNIQTRRKRLGLTQAGLAEILGIGQQALSRMERGGIAPKFERLQDIASALQCLVTDLFEDDSAKEDNKGGEEDIFANHLAEILRELLHEEKMAVFSVVKEMAFVFKKLRLQARNC